jgi:1,4-dihydroxy-2-naphthoate octaprenyltransferase
VNKIDKHKLIITLIFFIMSVLNFYGLLNIQPYGVFGLTFGALLICISTCFEGNLNVKNIDIWEIIKNLFYFGGWIFIVITVYLKENAAFKEFMTSFNGDTLMLLSLAFTFLSLMVSDWNQKNQKEKNANERKRIDELIKIQEEKQKELDKLIEKIKRKKTGED